MDGNVSKLLEENGFDVEGTMKRFLNNDALYMKCLKKFLDDESFGKLKAAYETGNCEEAFKAAHTMKGFVSNLGINRLYEAINPMVEKLRVGNMDIAEELKKVEVLHRSAYELIEKL